MQLIKQEKFNKIIKENFDYDFDVEKRGLCVVSITATCRSGKQIKERGGEDLRVEIDGQSFREIPPDKKIQLYNIPASWNGTKLKGLKKTVVFILCLGKGNHKITFIPHKGAKIENLEIKELGQNIKHSIFDINEQAEDGDRRPWYTFVLVDLSLKQIKVRATTKWRFPDSDDVKLIIDGKIQKPEGLFSKWKNWLWSGSIFKKLFEKETQTKTIETDLSQGVHYIEFHADRMPTLHKVELDFGEEIKEQKRSSVEPKTQEYIIEQIRKLYKEAGYEKEVVFDKIPKPLINFTKYDKEIEIASEEFDVDPTILKATIAQESGFGENIEHDRRYVGESGLMGLEKTQSIKQLENLEYNFDYNDMGDVIRASAAYYKWLREEVSTVIKFEDENNPLKLYAQYRINYRATELDAPGIKEFLYYYFYYK